MKKFIVIFIILFLLFIAKGPQVKGETYYVDVTYQVKEVTEFSTSGNPPPLIIDSMEAGQEWTEVSDDSTTYSFATNVWSGYKKITGKIDQNMPNYTYLKVNLETYVGESQGDVSLDTSEKNLVTDIEGIDWDCIITYKFGATAQAGAISGSRTVTFTLSDM